MKKKYKLTKETKEYCGRTLYRIEAVRDFNDVERGEKGGFIEKEDNLSHANDAWVSGDAWVYGNARVSGDARVYGVGRISGRDENKEEMIELDGKKWSKETIKEALRKHAK